MTEEEFPEPTWRSVTPVSYYGRRFGLLVTLNARLFWALDVRRDNVHVCIGPLEVSAWRRP